MTTCTVFEKNAWGGAWYRRAWEITTLINPANHAISKEAIATYKVEPYVMAADVYSVAHHTDAAAGPGIPAPPAGCTGSSSNPCWASAWKWTSSTSCRARNQGVYVRNRTEPHLHAG
jgi:cellobiose phosphorylase